MKKIASQVGSLVVSSRCLEVPKEMFGSEELEQIIENMRTVNDEMKGVGISANQVGSRYRISLVHVKQTEARPELKDSGEIIMINPEVKGYSDDMANEWEGCLSVAEAGLFAFVARPESVTVTWTDPSGQSKEQVFSGFLARVVQHELAHLEGRVFLQESGVDLQSFNSRSEFLAKMAKKEI